MILKINRDFSLYAVNQLVFLTDTDCVLCQVGTEHTHICNIHILIFIFSCSYQKDKRVKYANFEIKQYFSEIESIRE
jgi:hypothetical protein